MQSILKPSLILVALVTLVSVVIYATGFHENFLAGQMVFLALAIAINVAVIVWSLSQSADSHGYGQQLAKAAGIGAVSAVLIIATSWLLLAVVFPDTIPELRDAAIAYMESADMPQEQVDAQMVALDNTTAISQALPGGLGAFFTSVVTGAVFAIFRRRKEP